MSEKRPPRSVAEWTTFLIAVAVLLVVVAAIGVEAGRSDDPARPVAVVGRTERAGPRYQVHVTVENTGDMAASNVQVVTTLESGGDKTEGDQVVDFLAGGDEQELVFVFDDDPRGGQLKAEVTGFTVP